MSKIQESYWKLASAQVAKSKASLAHMQTGEMGRKKTIISVDADESMVIYMALNEYIEKHRREYER